ncbi:hypothetical protein [Halovivax gelatinilyticus]|uniref:hypothetical protein n=1 Tax=Halovivax gelatinilyticus TaxID=2961597 RepID=UPI0020CA8FB1|nr:hypothetical protein [Halovivax gelatinilyticus]
MPLTTVAKNLPWQALFQGTYLFRRYLFAMEPEPVEHVLVEGLEPDELTEVFLSAGLLKGDYASYYYFGEELNMVHGIYKPDEFEWYQYHVRGFSCEAGTRLRPHTELYWRMYPKRHMRLENLSVEEGVARTEEILDEAAVDYEVVDGPIVGVDSG